MRKTKKRDVPKAWLAVRTAVLKAVRRVRAAGIRVLPGRAANDGGRFAALDGACGGYHQYQGSEGLSPLCLIGVLRHVGVLDLVPVGDDRDTLECGFEGIKQATPQAPPPVPVPARRQPAPELHPLRREAVPGTAAGGESVIRVRVMFCRRSADPLGTDFPMEVVRVGNVDERSWADARRRWEARGFATRDLVLDVPDGALFGAAP